jgi:hypothetical protein
MFCLKHRLLRSIDINMIGIRFYKSDYFYDGNNAILDILSKYAHPSVSAGHCSGFHVMFYFNNIG